MGPTKYQIARKILVAKHRAEYHGTSPLDVLAEDIRVASVIQRIARVDADLVNWARRDARLASAAADVLSKKG